MMSEGLELAREYHRNLPPHLREHLQQARGISPEIIDLHVLGWNGSRVTIRICDRAGQAGLGAEGPDRRSENTGHARSPRRALWGGARSGESRAHYHLRGRVRPLVLESHGFAALTSTGGALTLRPEWAEELRRFPLYIYIYIYIYLDRDAAGRARRRAVVGYGTAAHRCAAGR